MASQTLAVALNYFNDELVAGVAEDIITTNPIFGVLPYTSYTGQKAIVNREPGNIDSIVSTAGVGTDLGTANPVYKTATAAPTQTTSGAVKIIGDVVMDNLVALTSGSAGFDVIGGEISSKAKGISRNFQTGMATGDGSGDAGTGNGLNSFHGLVDAQQYTTASAGQALSYALLDELLDLVTIKDGQVDFIMMPPRTFRSYKALLRAQGGTTADWVVTLPDGRNVIGYEDIPVFKNAYLPVTETANGAALTTGALTSVWAGCFDDGSKRIGVTAIYPEGSSAGISVDPIGARENEDATIWRVKQYANLSLFNRRGLARLPSINN